MSHPPNKPVPANVDRSLRGAAAYSVYRAAQDRADRAQDELADEHSESLA
jgi:hypothetical protein